MGTLFNLQNKKNILKYYIIINENQKNLTTKQVETGLRPVSTTNTFNSYLFVIQYNIICFG